MTLWAPASRVPLWARLVLGTLGLAAIGLSVTGLVGVHLFRDYLIQQSGQQLMTEARTIASAHWDKPTYQTLNCGNVPNDNAVELIGEVGGSTLLSSCDATVRQSTAASAEPTAAMLADAAADGRPITLTSTVGSAKVAWQIAIVRARYREVAPTTEYARPSADAVDRATTPSTVSGVVGGYVLVATPLDEIDATVGHLVDLDVVVDAAVAMALLVLGYLLVHRTLRPLRRIESAAAAISAGDLARRVPRGHPKTEIGRLAASLNGMLGKIESAFGAQARSEAEAQRSEARMRRFIADAGHELRTPLASIRGITELYRQGAVEEDQVPDMLRRVEDEATRMGLLVEDLLLLARLDQQRPLARDRVHLVALAADSIIAARARASDRSIELRLDRPEPPYREQGGPDERGEADERHENDGADEGRESFGEPIVIGDENRLRQALDNLLTNAVCHTPAGTPITMRVRPADDTGHCVLEVADAGPGLSTEDAARVFERFYRSDRSRARTSAYQGSGLGLAIVAAIAHAHGGSASVRSEPGQGACFTLRLPAAAEADAARL